MNVKRGEGREERAEARGKGARNEGEGRGMRDRAEERGHRAASVNCFVSFSDKNYFKA